jgi:hypothetical protein
VITDDERASARSVAALVSVRMDEERNAARMRTVVKLLVIRESVSFLVCRLYTHMYIYHIVT